MDGGGNGCRKYATKMQRGREAADVLRLVCCFEAREPLADVFSSETGAPSAPSRPLPQAEATVSTESTSPLMRSLKKAGVRGSGAELPQICDKNEKGERGGGCFEAGVLF